MKIRKRKDYNSLATRAGIEKLIYSQYATRKEKQILPTDDGKVLVEICADFLKSASMTAEWKSAALDGAWRDCTGTVYDRDQKHADPLC